MKDVVIDNSSLSAILKSESLQEGVAHRLVEEDARLIIPAITLKEALSGATEDIALHNIQGMLHIADLACSRVAIGETGPNVWVTESNSKVGETPVVVDGIEHLRARVHAGGYTADELQSITREVQREKEKYRSLSEGTADLILTDIPEFGEQNIQDVCEALKKFSFAAVPEWWIQSALKFAGIPESRSRNVVGEEEKWQSLRAWTALSYLDMFSSIYPHLPEDRSNLDAELLRLLKPHQNNSYDSAIAAGAAYGELLVSNDQNLTARCEHLRKRGCLKFRTVARDDWLLAAPRRTSPSC